jgi:glutamate-ammonia-ligase adenylyltransferase
MNALDTLPAISPLPDVLQDEVAACWSRIRETSGVDFPEAEQYRRIEHVWAVSPFVAEYCAKDPARFVELQESGDLGRSYGEEEYAQRLSVALEVVGDEAGLMRFLRQFRNREMVRIAWRDIAGQAGLEETLSDLSRFADAALDAALNWLHRQLSATFGIPQDERGQPQSLVVIAMGKLGAHELNFSSDIDLIFVYPKAGETAGGTKTLSNHEFFDRLGQKLIKALSEVTADGYVFRVDMRLRPFGESGPLVLSFDAMEQYYTTHARDWERYAMIKARCCAGDRAAGEQLLKLLRPFVYRRYLDFGAFQALREMKRLINDEVRRKGIESNVKLGRGGIREIEFIGQTFQLIRGGRVPALQTRRILDVLECLGKLGYLPREAVDDLTTAYVFLRNTEHRLQQIRDQQTQSLPKDDLDRLRVALGMGFENWEAFSKALETHRGRVQHHFDQLLDRAEGEPATAEKPLHADLWQGNSDPATLENEGFDDPSTASAVIANLKGLAGARGLSRTEQARLDRLMPMLLTSVTRTANPTATLERIARLIETIVRRSVYLALLTEHPDALAQLVKLCSASPWLAGYVTRQPILLDELLDPRTLYAPPGPDELDAQLEGQLAQVDPQDLERQMETLRHFKHAQVLRVAASDIAGVLPVAKVSDHLTAIAETVLRAALRLAWGHFTTRHGIPECLDEGVKRPAGFAIIAYGKLGGLELGYGSDLDLVFLHDSRGTEQVTNGPKPLDNPTFFARLGQRIIHLINTVTPAGKAYDIDTRLRPSGASGLLVSNLDAYREYQESHAWTWEHQALIRARPVAGDPRTAAGFNAIRRETLGQPRGEAKLKHDIREMREKMREALCKKEPGMFDLKQGAGGITDIEFMVQYAVLRWAAGYPELLEATSNRLLLEFLAASHLLEDDACQAFRDAYFAYRAKTHALALQEESALVSETEFEGHRAKVADAWNRLIET